MSEEETQEELEFVFVPTLVALLRRAEQLKQSPLTEAEVLAIRDDATVTAVRPVVAAAMEAERGYADIAPEDCWQEWQQVCTQFCNP